MNNITNLTLYIIFAIVAAACNNANPRTTSTDSTTVRDTGAHIHEELSRTFCPPAETSNLEMRVVPQEEDSWCWAACGEMVLTRVKGVRISQCDQASARRRDGGDCCNGQQGTTDCLGGGWPDFKHYEVDFDTTRNDEPLPWDTIVNQINCKKVPICASWRFDGGGGHMAVISAYKIVGGIQFLYILDPEYEGSERWWTYDRYKLGPILNDRPMFTHWKDFYNIVKL